MSSRNVTKTDSLQQSCDDQVILSSNEHDESSSDNYHIESDDDDFFVLDKDDMPSEPGASSASAAGIVAETSSKREADQLKVAEGQVIRGYLHGRKEDLEFQRELHLDQEHRLEKLSSSEMVLHTYNNKGMISSAPKVHQRWFYSLPRIRRGDPTYGFETLHSEGQPEVNPESLPEDLSARFSSSVRRNLSSDTTHLDKLGFRLVANFSSVASGQYSLHLLIKQASDEMAAARFCVRVVVRYPMTRMSQVFYTRFFKSSRDDGSNWCFLKAEGQVEIYPQVGSAQLNVNIAPDDAFLEYSGTLMIRSILLVPIGTKPVSSVPILSRVSQVDHSFALQSADTPGSPRNNTKADRTLASNDTLSWRPSNDTLSWRATIAEGDGQIVRLATSKNGAFLAALSTFANQFMVHVWHMDDLKTDQSNSTFTDVARAGFASEPISCPGARGLPLELAISATGEYVAVFQAPMIGDWLEGSSVPKSAVGVRLFRRPRTSSEQIFVPVDSRSPVSNVLSIQDTPASLKHAVGYAVFAGELTTGTNRTPARFVHCNGLYLEVYVLNENGIQRGLTIPLTSLSSALLRTTACELMMRSIVANMFIWVEDNGRYCSTWDLNNGAALGRIEITSRLFHGSSAGVSEMNIACSRNIVAIVGFDNSITTIDATSGVLLSRRTIYDRIIEHIAFPSAHSQMLVVMLRAEDENKQTGLILDPLCLDVQEYVWSIPPLSSSAVFGQHGMESWPETGVLWRPDGPLIHSSLVRGPTPVMTRRQHQLAASPAAIGPYELRTTSPRSWRGADGEHSAHSQQVEIWNKDSSKRVFAFTPEPWDQQGIVGGMILPTGDSFVVHGNWTIQLWSLPTTDQPRCMLLFFWSVTEDGQMKENFGKTDLEIIMERYTRISSAFVHEYTGSDNQALYRASVVVQGGSVQQVLIPSNPTRYSDFQFVTKSCIASVWLLAQTHALVSSDSQGLHMGDQDVDNNRDHALAIIDFVNAHINHIIDPGTPKEGTILNRLLSLCVTDLSSKFIAVLLESKTCRWVPSIAVKRDPVEIAIRCKNSAAVRVILEYCIKKAASTSPAFLLPAERSFKALIEYYPEIAQDVFREASFIPARQIDFNKNYAAKSTFHWDIKKLVFSFYLGGNKRPSLSNRHTVFDRTPPLDPISIPYDHKVYTVPFPSLTAGGSESQFHLLAGKDFFDSPIMMTVLRYKTWQYGLFSWMIRYIVLAVFYGTFLATTSGQLRSSRAQDAPPVPLSHFMGNHWIVIPIVGIVAGCYFVVEEVLQLVLFGPSRYFRSLYNYVEVTSIVLTIICLSQSIHMSWRQEPSAYRQFEVTPFAIVAMYLHLIAETRIFRAVGTMVNAIVLILQKIWAFFVVFVLLVVAFSHSLFFFFHAFQTECNDGGVCTQSPTKHPYNVLSSFTTTLFFLAGRYDVVADDFERHDTSFLLIMTIFYFVVILTMMNVFIAMMIDAFNSTYSHAEQARRVQLSEALSAVETVGRAAKYLFPSLGRIFPKHSPAPTYIYYVARIHDVETYRASIK